MPRNGSGVYSKPAGTTAVPNTVIESADFNSFADDVSEALTKSVNVDGTAPLQADQPMATHKLTGLGAGAAATDSAQLAQVQNSIVAHASAVGGTADAITLTFSPVFTAWTAKMRFRFTAGGANTTTTPTVNIDGLGAKTIKKLAGAALVAGDIAGSGHICDCVYNGTDVMLVNLNSVAAASETVSGIVELATVAEAQAGTDTARAVTPAGLAAATREQLTANRTYYVRTDGSNSNTGLVDSAGGAFLTIQKAVDVAASLDFNGFTLTIQVGAGTYTAAVVLSPVLRDADKFIIQGNTGTPGNVIVSVTGGDCFTAADGAQGTVQGFEVRTTSSGNGLVATRDGVLKFGAMNFGANVTAQVSASWGGTCKAISDYTINGNAARHFSASNGGRIDATSLTITLSGSRTFTFWAVAIQNGVIDVFGTAYSGSATGNRGSHTLGGGLNSGGTTQPGNSGPTTTSPGWAT